MNINTGEIKRFAIGDGEFDAATADADFKKQYLSIEETQMTQKQKANMKVSLHDHTSKLGKTLTKARSIAGLTKNQARRLKRKLKKG